jgi:large subunit ribosomal protein L4
VVLVVLGETIRFWAAGHLYKTKELITKLKGLDVEEVLIVSDVNDENIYLAARNLHNVDACDVNELDPVSLLDFDKVLITAGAVKKLEERLS